MSDIAIKVENLSKQYRLGEVGTGTISHDLNRWWAKIRGKEDPFLKIGETNDRSSKGNSEYVWALKDINFEVKKGEILGIIGKNGAGKSTLLKILSKVTGPTTGEIKGLGRVASLLEVGTGFHPELTGRENIYLNGTILGMTKREVSKKLDEIVDFAGVERYLDTPVKRYSSGMMVRLGFAVAAHLEPEILIVDEVLAVGDAEFQKKAIGKMQEVSKGEGRTVLFVSHNMGSINALCSQCLLLSKGTVSKRGDVTKVVFEYLNENRAQSSTLIKNNKNRNGTGQNKFTDIYFEDYKGDIINQVISGQSCNLVFSYEGKENILKPQVKFTIYNRNGLVISHFDSNLPNKPLPNLPSNGKVKFYFKKLPLSEGEYSINVVIVGNGIIIDYIRDVFFFNVLPGNFFNSGRNISVFKDICLIEQDWVI